MVIIGLGFPCQCVCLFCALLRWFLLCDISGIQGNKREDYIHCRVWQDPFHHPPSGYIISNYSMICSSITITSKSKRIRRGWEIKMFFFHILKSRHCTREGERRTATRSGSGGDETLDEFSRRIVMFSPTLLHLLYWGLLLEHRGKGLRVQHTCEGNSLVV